MNYHLTDSGAKPCRAEKPDRCPLGGDHFSDEKSALEAYEKTMQSLEIAPFLKKSTMNDSISEELKKFEEESFDSSAPVRYHICRAKDLESIQTYGLIPRIGKNSADLGEEEPGVYLFSSRDHIEDAGWIEEAFEEDEDLVVLEVEGVASTNEDFYETVAKGRISPQRLKITHIKV